ncbi:MAG: hypothetical protein IT317_06290 [Anaerolineales bacterium]|nr:hypothetical protein [Anaerolineales bacterium]
MNNRRLLVVTCAGLTVLGLCLALTSVLSLLVYQRMRRPPVLPEATIDLTGHMVLGFEVASFVPCGREDSGEAYWLSADPGVELYDAYHAATGTEDYIPVYAHVLGRLSPPGQYGHLNAYTRELTVTEIITLNTTGACP